MKNVTKPAEPTPRKHKPRATISVQRGTRAIDAPTRNEIMRFARAAMMRDMEITLRIVNEIEGQQLNFDYRHKDYATNVLSFVYESEPTVHGDLVLCAPVISREATEQGKSVLAHYAHMIVHGVLHLHGYDHLTDNEATAMEALEIAIMVKLGFANPYLTSEQLHHG
ncbi:MAG: rRNA maturation RNase YbeY [Sulfuriferula sp.]